ncbi:PQQ-dependent sugar dehydrogenase [Mesobaculum littorinae]
MGTASLAVAMTNPVFAQSDAPVDQGPANAEFEPAFPEQTRAPAVTSEGALATESLASGLVHPWGIAILPEGAGYLVTERTGQLRHVSSEGELSGPITGAPEVYNQEQGGLLDVAIGPDFASDRWVYFTYSKPLASNGMSATAAARGKLSEDLGQITQMEEIFVQEPGSPSPMHYGSRVVFDDAGHVFITTGEHFTEDQRVYAQDKDKTYGKVVRLNLDGSIPEDNPFVGEGKAIESIWSLGQRNIQGAAVNPETGDLWTIEHGPAGGDELNLQEAGANYGWPVVSYGVNYDGSPVGSEKAAHEPEGFVEPRYYWDPVIAPGDMTFYDGEMFPEWQGDALIGGLVAGGIVRLVLDGDTVTGEERILSELGRTRDVAVDDDGSLLLITDFEDGELIRVTAEGGTGTTDATDEGAMSDSADEGGMGDDASSDDAAPGGDTGGAMEDDATQ